MAKVERDLEQLQEVVARRQGRARSKQKARYELAKSLGFAANEAVVLQNWKEEDIRRIAQERGEQQ